MSTEFTPQYWQLNVLADNFMESSFSIVGFPCDQFAHQEPGANKTELLAGLRYVRPGMNYTPHFTLHMKIHVNGEDEQPLYRYLKDSCPVPLDASYDRSESFWDPIKVNDISWNFEKFLIDHNGRPLFRFRPDVEPMDLRELVELMLDRSLDP
ncbi:epididymal secretory glutathione peroxidase-like [Haliotis rubra]|uniref:epididymal secretory glutathione peroxidase-like n=1 Tax=Haliotis rubra TaxID=36100 RepID=UPI001EE59E72|nr:epididymal secretory glutathione peroxidase-like [Haliotis rubra]